MATLEFNVKLVAATYQFFNGSVPLKEGFQYLIDSPANPTDLNDPYYAGFNNENLYINFANNFAATVPVYSSSTFAAAVAEAYGDIVGYAAAEEKGIDVAAAISFFVNAYDYYKAVALERVVSASVPLDQAIKTVMVGSMLHESIKAGVGEYAEAVNYFYADAIDGQSDYFGKSILNIDVNDAPIVVAGDPLVSTAEGSIFALDISKLFADPDGNPLTFSVENNPFVTLTGSILTFKPGYEASGQYTLDVTASDGKLSTTTELTFDVTNRDKDVEIRVVTEYVDRIVYVDKIIEKIVYVPTPVPTPVDVTFWNTAGSLANSSLRTDGTQQFGAGNFADDFMLVETRGSGDHDIQSGLNGHLRQASIINGYFQAEPFIRSDSVGTMDIYVLKGPQLMANGSQSDNMSRQQTSIDLSLNVDAFGTTGKTFADYVVKLLIDVNPAIAETFIEYVMDTTDANNNFLVAQGGYVGGITDSATNPALNGDSVFADSTNTAFWDIDPTTAGQQVINFNDLGDHTIRWEVYDQASGDLVHVQQSVYHYVAPGSSDITFT